MADAVLDAKLREDAARTKKKYETEMFGLLTTVWGEHLHMGLFESPDESLAVASERSTATIAADAGLRAGQRVVDVACGVGGSARSLARTLGVTVEALDISEAQLQRGRDLTRDPALATRIHYANADFHRVPLADGCCDVWWCQEAMLYASDKRRVIEEGLRVVRPGGRLVLSDLLQRRNMPDAERGPFMARLGASHMWTIEDYDDLIAEMGLEVLVRHDWWRNVAPTYERVAAGLIARRDAFADRVGAEAVDSTIARVVMQRDAARDGHLGWCYYLIAA
jgi:sarcosine/dimethylglycine N-methyltransferase